jgi:hypothetical protein
VALLTWRSDTFAYAESHDEGAARYRGLRGGQLVSLAAETAGLLVKPDVAQRQIDAEAPPTTTGEVPDTEAGAGIRAGESSPTDPGARGVTPGGVSAPLRRRFHGTVSLDPARVGRDASRIAMKSLRIWPDKSARRSRSPSKSKQRSRMAPRIRSSAP